MNDPEKNRQRDHWQAIAEQLGLAPDPLSVEERPQAATAKGAADAVESELLPQPARTESRQRPTPEPARSLSRPAEQRGFGEGLTLEPEATPTPEVAETRAPKEFASQPEEREERHQPQPARPRAERTPARESQEVAQAPAGNDRPDSEGEETPARRGRRRSRVRKPEVLDAPAPMEPEEPATIAPIEEDDENLDLSTWDVPSWNDLIASLYRPER